MGEAPGSNILEKGKQSQDVNVPASPFFLLLESR